MINEKMNFWLWAGWVASLSAQVDGESRCHLWPLKTAIFCGQGLRRLPWMLSMWGKIMIPMNRLWLHGLYGLYGPHCPLSPKRLLNRLTHSTWFATGVILKQRVDVILICRWNARSYLILQISQCIPASITVLSFCFLSHMVVFVFLSDFLSFRTMVKPR